MIPVLAWLACAVIGPWLLIGGLVALMFGIGVVEVVALEVAGIGFVLVGVGVLLLILIERRSGCSHDPDCGSVR